MTLNEFTICTPANPLLLFVGRTVLFITMSSSKEGQGHTLFSLIKEIFNWYPSSYPAAERK